MLRVFMIPAFLFFYFMQMIMYNYLFAWLIFVAASVTDMADGNIARKRGLVTDFGKLMDPLADKLLVTSALCCLLPQYGVLGIISLILILSREFLVTSIRLIAAGKGEVLAADFWGKLKTAVQMIWICLKLFAMAFAGMPPALERLVSGLVGALFFLMVFLTVASGVHYVNKNRKLFADA